jgi:hypothetical protein
MQDALRKYLSVISEIIQFEETCLRRKPVIRDGQQLFELIVSEPEREKNRREFQSRLDAARKGLLEPLENARKEGYSAPDDTNLRQRCSAVDNLIVKLQGTIVESDPVRYRALEGLKTLILDDDAGAWLHARLG